MSVGRSGFRSSERRVALVMRRRDTPSSLLNTRRPSSTALSGRFCAYSGKFRDDSKFDLAFLMYLGWITYALTWTDTNSGLRREFWILRIVRIPAGYTAVGRKTAREAQQAVDGASPGHESAGDGERPL